MMKKIAFGIILFTLVLGQGWLSFACVGRTLYVGTLNNTEEQLLAEMLVLLINERTGTSVKIKQFEDQTALYQALQEEKEEKRVDIVLESTDDAMARLGLKSAGDLDKEFLAVKDAYERELNIIWLSPFGFSKLPGHAGASISAPLIRKDVLENFPLLPRVLNKLAGALSDEVFAALLAQIKSGEKIKNVSRDFLEDKKFI